jgi:hypothetical protein
VVWLNKVWHNPQQVRSCGGSNKQNGFVINFGGWVQPKWDVVSHNNHKQSDLGELSPFLQKAAKMPPAHPSRSCRRYVHLAEHFR